MFYCGKILDGGDRFYILINDAIVDGLNQRGYPICAMFERSDNGVAFLKSCTHLSVDLGTDMEVVFPMVYDSLRQNIYDYSKKNGYVDSKTIASFENVDGVISWFKKQYMRFADDYVCEGSKTIIVNKTGMSDETAMDIISHINPQHVNKATLKPDFLVKMDYYNQPCMYSDSGDEIVIPRWRNGRKFCYANKSYIKWGDENINKFTFIDNKDLLKKRFYYFDIDDEQKELTINRIEVSFNNKAADEEKSQVEQFEFILKRTYSMKYSLKGDSYCRKHMARSDKDVMPMEVFNINSKNILHPDGEFLFRGSCKMREFFINNYTFFERCGFAGLARLMDMNICLEASFILFVSMIFEYPQVEILAKMGHVSLIEGIFLSMIRCSMKESIRAEVKSLSSLINENSTKGSQALRFPTYIGDYLKETKGSIGDYMFWRDVFEISNVSMENFNKFLASPEMTLINMDISKRGNQKNDGLNSLGIQEILKYGYDFVKTMNYLVKLSLGEDFRTICDAAHTMKDTLSMAEQLNVDIEKYPDNLNQLHDELSELFSKHREEIEDNKFNEIVGRISEKVKKAFESDSVTLPRNAMEKFTYVIPQNRQDFVQEGINQHNCVGGYYRHVVDKYCIIFFVRKKESPDESYITAEVTKRGIGQVMFSNNRPVSPTVNKLEWQYVSFIASTLKPLLEETGFSS